MGQRNPDVDAWFERYDNPLKPLVMRVRDILLDADPRIGEAIKWSTPTFVYKGNLASFQPRRSSSSASSSTRRSIPGEHPLLEGGGDTARYARLAGRRRRSSAHAPALEAVVRAWCDARDRLSRQPMDRADGAADRAGRSTRRHPRARPKVLLHDHLDGGLRPGTVIELAAEVGYRELPTTDPGRARAWFTSGADRKSLELYLEGFRHTVAVMQTRDAIERVAAECVEDLAADGVVYAEVRMAPELLTDGGLSLDEAVDGHARRASGAAPRAGRSRSG